MMYGSIGKADEMTGELPTELWSFDVLTDQWKCEHLQTELWNLDMDLQ